MVDRLKFSGGMIGKNLRFVDGQPRDLSKHAQVGFLLLEHFSLPAFTQALDAIVTANLLRPRQFTTRTFALSEGEVISDLSLVIRADASLQIADIEELGLLVVVFGSGWFT